MSYFLIYLIVYLQVMGYLIFRGHLSESISFSFWNFLKGHPILSIYLCGINILTFLVYAIDKMSAIREKRRIKIVTLLGLAFFGGSIGALTGMYLLHHKTRKTYFTIGVPLMLVMQIMILFFAMNFRI